MEQIKRPDVDGAPGKIGTGWEEDSMITLIIPI